MPVLFGLLALPVIWWLLRLTPPRPRSELFPPLRILARVLQKEETPSKSPWWLTLLLHRFPDAIPYDDKLQQTDLEYLFSSEAAMTSLAENYVGLPF